MESQIEAQIKLIRTLEEKDNMVGINVKNMEQELQLRQQVKHVSFKFRISRKSMRVIVNWSHLGTRIA